MKARIDSMNKLLYIGIGGLFFSLLLCSCLRAPVVTVDRLEDLDGVPVGVPRGTTHELYVIRHTKAVLKSYDETTDAVQALCEKKVCAAVTNRAVGSVTVKENPSLYLNPLDLGKDPVGIAVGRSDSLLRDSINVVISDLKERGVLKEMEKRWLSFSESYQPVEIEVEGRGAPLRVAVAATREPFCFQDDSGRLCGYDVELAHRIAARLHRPLKFVNMKFSALIAALLSGKADVVISLLDITPERLQVVDFTQPYYESDRVLILRKKG